MPKAHTIHHFEDEPELLRWIPSVLFNRYWSRFHDWVRNEGNFQEQEGSSTFELHVGGEVHIVEYRVYTSLSEFEQNFRPKAQDVALIDVMESGEPRGLDVYQRVIKTLDADAVYLVTSFPNTVTIPIPPRHILPKPLDVTELADLLIDRLAIGDKG